uniref:Transposase IS66 central domain-containing protein n=1 Tax=Rhizobium leguminosarum bv. viciae TaxID=387 RepID=A0A0U3J726_RHILV|nr:hypothetical protein [Rhizobium leguminosarum bv. viciae]
MVDPTGLSSTRRATVDEPAADASSKLFADETTAPVLDPGRGKTKTRQLWGLCPR